MLFCNDFSVIVSVPVFIKGTDLSKRKQLTPFQHQHIQHKLCNVDYLNSDCYMMMYELLHGQEIDSNIGHNENG